LHLLKPYLTDLHVHTVLSPCAEVEMIPPLIIKRAKQLGLGMIAITDHNACHNVEALVKASEGSGVHVFPGMEVQTREEVHLLCLFDTVAQCQEWQEQVFRGLPPLTNREEVFGPQYVVDASGEWVRTEERLLSVSTHLRLEEAIARVHELSGIAIPAHVDRPSFSLLSNLGFVPENLGVEGLEVTSRFSPESGFDQWPQLKSWSLIVNGDAHRLLEMQNRTLFEIAVPAVQELSFALMGQNGRRVSVKWPDAPITG
jgi:PHP family Zn ribbon phosphoesterase